MSPKIINKIVEFIPKVMGNQCSDAKIKVIWQDHLADHLAIRQRWEWEAGIIHKACMIFHSNWACVLSYTCLLIVIAARRISGRGHRKVLNTASGGEAMKGCICSLWRSRPKIKTSASLLLIQSVALHRGFHPAVKRLKKSQLIAGWRAEAVTATDWMDGSAAIWSSADSQLGNQFEFPSADSQLTVCHKNMDF